MPKRDEIAVPLHNKSSNRQQSHSYCKSFLSLCISEFRKGCWDPAAAAAAAVSTYAHCSGSVAAAAAAINGGGGGSGSTSSGTASSVTGEFASSSLHSLASPCTSNIATTAANKAVSHSDVVTTSSPSSTMASANSG
jgi:hypothetical protein